MKLYEVYPLFDVTPKKAYGATVWDVDGNEYLDFYGGHAVISIGHSHPHYVDRITKQIAELGFYSNSIVNPLQLELASLLFDLSDLDEYNLFLCNSGAEANENALKLASFNKPDSNKIIAFKNGFHGRTSAAVNVTDIPKIQSKINKHIDVIMFDHHDEEAVIKEILKGDSCAVMLEVIQGIGGLDIINNQFLENISKACKSSNTLLIADEVQSGYGRSGKFFAFQYSDVVPDIITIAKGMGNGFPIGGVLISEKLKAWHGQLGTTFGGNHLACAAGLAVLEVMQKENVISSISKKSEKLNQIFSSIPVVKRIKGKGLMLGVEFDFPVKKLREALVYDQNLFTGSSKNPNILRLLPPLTITYSDIDLFTGKFMNGISNFLKTINYE